MRDLKYRSIFLTSVILGISASPTHAASVWTSIANEHESFTLSGTQTVRFGVGSSWVQKVLTGTNACTLATFGSDPAYGLSKVCQVSSVEPTPTWTSVANERQSFTLSGTQTVRFGVGSSWVQKVLTGTNACTLATFGSDPAYGLSKVCQVSSIAPTTTTTTAPTSTSTSSWTSVANERQSFTLSGTQTVRFGVGSSWVQKVLTGTNACTLATFGSDPAYGLSKVCQVLSVAPTSTPVPASYNAKLSWVIPTTRADGAPLLISELAGYQVYYTNTSGTVNTVLPLAGGTVTTAVISSLSADTYYFSISAIDTNGVKSALSTVVPITFP